MWIELETTRISVKQVGPDYLIAAEAAHLAPGSIVELVEKSGSSVDYRCVLLPQGLDAPDVRVPLVPASDPAILAVSTAARVA